MFWERLQIAVALEQCTVILSVSASLAESCLCFSSTGVPGLAFFFY